MLLFSHSVVSKSLQPHGPRVCSDSCPLSQWCHPTISSSVVPFSSCLQSFPASGSFPRSQLFASGGQSIGASASASVLPMNIQDWFPLGRTGWISLQSKGLSRVFSRNTMKTIPHPPREKPRQQQRAVSIYIPIDAARDVTLSSICFCRFFFSDGHSDCWDVIAHCSFYLNVYNN